MPAAQLERLYGSEVAESLAFKGYAFRSMHSHGRALFGLLPRALGGDGGTRHVSVDGEFVAGAALGWNFGEGHQDELFAAYGIARDPERIAYYRALWELES